MGLEQASTSEIVEKAVSHKWGVPEFQRGFVWTPQKVRDLVDSLWRGYPVGSFLVWYSQEDVEPKVAEDQADSQAWVVDGQQRTTALAILLGRKPYWWEGDWDGTLNHHDVRFNVLAEDEPYFSLRTAAMKGQAERPWVKVREVVAADDDELSRMIHGLLTDLSLPDGKFGMLWTRLDRVRKLRDAQIPILTVMLELEDVTEIFARLNSAGTKVTEADIALALAASQNPGWARTEFLPFLHQLEEAGFDVDPNLVFRSAVAIGLGQARLKAVPRSYWKGPELATSWIRTRKSWQAVIDYVEQRGILSADVMPTKNVLIPLTLLVDRFPGALKDGRPFAWLLHATRSQRYGGSAITVLDKDVRLIRDASSWEEALAKLKAEMEPWEPFVASDFLIDYSDRILRLFLYLIMWHRGARDWVSKQRLGFQGTDLLERFSPEWHHIFPRKYLRDSNIPEEQWNPFANIAVIATDSNIRFGGAEPSVYLAKYDVDEAQLREQLVSPSLLSIGAYDSFLADRAAALAGAANAYFDSLSSGREST